MLTGGQVAAQTPVSLQPNFDTVDAPSLYLLAGLGGDRRQQLVISADVLKPFQKATLAGIGFRRDAGHSWSLPALAANMTWNLSPARTTWDRVLPVFTQNAGNARTQVFAGVVQAPASPKPGTGYQPWAATNALTMPFSTTYAYVGGDLCVDLDARVEAASRNGFWPVDGVFDPAEGSVIAYGKGCTGFVVNDGFNIHGEEATLRIGASTRVKAVGRPGCSGIFVLGLSKVDLDLAFMGANGCRLLVQPWIQFPVGYNPPEFATSSAWATIPYHIPPINELRSARAFVQVIDNETSLPRQQWSNASGLTTGNGLALTISGALPSLGITGILSHGVDATSPLPTFGKVNLTSAPILRFWRR